MSVDSRSTIKVKLKKILHSDIDYSNFYNIVTRTNEIINCGYMFIRSFLLHVIEHNNSMKNKISEPKINIEFIRLAFSVISAEEKKGGGAPFKQEKQELIDKLTKFFQNYKIDTDTKSYSALNLSYILGQTYDQIYTAIKNNIIYHFDKHVWAYVKANFNEKYVKLKENKEFEKLKEFKSELNNVKNDILNNTDSSPKKYKKWIKTSRTLIIPSTYTENNFDKDVNNNTFDYIKCMYHINKFIQKKELKSYQIFPIRTSSYQKYVKINTSALIDIFYIQDKEGEDEDRKETKNKMCTNAGNIILQEKLWNKYFKLKDSRNISRNNREIENEYKFRKSGFSFNYEIETDGFGVSLNFINNNEICNKEQHKKNKKLKKQKNRELKKNNTEEKLKVIQQKEKEDNEKKDDEWEIKLKNRSDEKKKEYKIKTDEEKIKVKVEMNDKCEFPYIGTAVLDLVKREQLKNKFENGKLLICDPGSKSLLYLTASNKVIHVTEHNWKTNNFGISIWNDHKIMDYTNKTRMKFTKRLHYAKLVEKWKDDKSNDKFLYSLKTKKNILKKMIKDKQDKKLINFVKKEIEQEEKSLKDIEAELSNYNTKSCKYSDFTAYVKKKNEYDKKVSHQYDAEYLQKLNWYAYLNKRRHEDKLLDHIENEFGKDITIIIGDYSGKGRIKRISTPNLGLKRKLKERFKVYLIDEYLTSKIHYKHNVRCENLKIKTKPEENKIKLHSVLSFKLEKGMLSRKVSMGCINRDKNAVLNMERIVRELVNTGERPDIFSRKKTQPNNQLDLRVKLADA